MSNPFDMKSFTQNFKPMIFQKALLKSLENYDDKEAIISSEVITYSKLLKNAMQIAAYIQKQNIDELSFIGAKLEDRKDMITTSIAIFLSRNVFVPLDANAPIERNENICKLAGLSLLITSKKEELEGTHQVTVDEILASETIAEFKQPEWNKDDNLYLYFTSGSTGNPKGILGKNESLLQFINWQIKEFELSQDKRYSQLVSPIFDAFLRDVYTPLLSGGTICIPNKEINASSDKLVQWINDTKINYIHTVPSLFRLFINTGLKSQDFEALNCIFLSGEVITPNLIKEWNEIFANRIGIVNFYGTTEATLISSFHKINAKDAERPRIPIGQPREGCGLQILNDNLESCPPLIPGDLYIVSDYLSNGYLDETLNKDKFVKVAINGTLQSAYKTGDIAKLTPDGSFELIGRKDRQIKLRGIRVELSEIENTLLKHPNVNQAIALVEGNEENSEQQLVTFVSLVNEMENGSDTIKNYLQDNLPSYMIPNPLVKMKEFPLLPNGKVDVQSMLKSLNEAEIAIKKPSNETEEALLKLWASLLRKNEISVDANFLTVGGNSILLMRLIGGIYKEFNVRLPLSSIFKNLSVELQAKQIAMLQQENIFKIQTADKKELYHLSSNQKRLFFQYESNKDSLAYNMPSAWEVHMDIDSQELQTILEQLINRHEAFRTRFVIDKGQLWQKIENNVDFKIQEIEVTGFDESILEAIKSFITPFQLNNAPLIRVALIKAKKFKNVLLIDMHHIVCDGLSQINLIKDFIQLYKGEKLEELNFTFKDYAEWENEYRLTDNYTGKRSFWYDVLGTDFQMLNLSVRSDEALPKRKGEYQMKLEENLIENIKNQLANNNVTNFSILYAAYQLLLSQLSGQNDIVIGINTIGRLQEELTPIIGMFSKSLPIRYKIEEKKSIRQMILEVHELLIKCNENQIYDLADIKQGTNHESSELFNTMLVYQNFDLSIVEDKELDFKPFNFNSSGAKYPLSLMVTGVNFIFEYDNSLFIEDDMTYMATSLKDIFNRIAENIDTTAKDFLQKEEFNATLSVHQDISFNI
nr:hypothetical protein BACY1_00480 [Tenacibaculum mesophilum]